MWIFPKIADFGIFDQFLAKNPPELSGDAVPTGHQTHGKGVIFGWCSVGTAHYKALPKCLGIQETNMLQLLYKYLRKILPPRRDAVNYLVISA